MKLLTLLLMLPVLLFSCKDEKPSDGGMNWVIDTASARPDTSIRQEAWHCDGKYYLQTYLMTNTGQIHPRSGCGSGMIAISDGTEFAPYIHEVSGTFEFVNAVKKDEMNKAIIFFIEKKENDSTIKAHLEILNSIQ